MNRRPLHRGPKGGVQFELKAAMKKDIYFFEEGFAKAVRWCRYGHWNPSGTVLRNQRGIAIWSSL